MRDATEATAAAPSRDVQLKVSAALVAGVAVVHLVMAYFVWSLSAAVFDVFDPLLGPEPARLMVSVTPSVPLAIVVLLWARDRQLGWIATLSVIGFAVLPYLRGLVVERLYDASGQGAASTFLDWSNWVLTALVPVGAALGWSIARRVGTRWWPGLLLAALVAALFRWLELDPFGDDERLRAAFAALVYHVVPALLAGVACWWLDVRERPE